MRDLLFIAYMAILLLACRLVARVPPMQLGAAPGLQAFLTLSILLFGGGSGAAAPGIIADIAAWMNGRPLWGVPQDLGPLGRLAQVVGAVCGAWIAVRGLWLWTVLSFAAGALYAGFALINWLLIGVWR